MWGTNEVGEQHFSDKSVRSFEHSPALLRTTFSDIRAVNIQGTETGAFTVDTRRIKTVMKACVCALHFYETGERIRNWEIVLPNLHLPSGSTDEASTAWLQVLSQLRQITFQVKTTASTDVFQYAIAKIEGGNVYSLRFYKNFLVYACAADLNGNS
jgi:hypothetical protein